MKKRGEEYLIEQIDKAISELVFDKFKLLKAYNYYNGRRDAEQFRYLEENFGIGNPTTVEFTPLIKKHIDALIGEYLETPILPKVSCKDTKTITNINREKMNTINLQVFNYLKAHLHSSIMKFIKGEDPNDGAIQDAIDKLVEDIDLNFISQYEIAALNVIEYIIQSRNTNLKNHLKELILDLLVAGCAFYRVKPSLSKSNVAIETLNPLNTFVDRNPESPYVKNSYRIVVRKWLSKQQILKIYGDDMSKEAEDELDDLAEHYCDNNVMYIRAMEGLVGTRPGGEAEGLVAGEGITPGFPYDSFEAYNYKLLPVYEVEWIDVDKEKGQYVQNRYSGVRIGQSIYITTGKDKNVVRTADDPTACSLSVNGVYIMNRDNVPQSLVLQCASLQDKYDLIQYFRDNVIANSGTDGDWIDVSMLPTFLGKDLTERLEKWQAYKKSGMGIIDTSQEGRAFNNNTSFAGFSDTIKVQTMQAFDLALQRIEDQCSSITGVFRERLNGILQRDAVSNVEAGAKNSYTITKPFYQNMDTLVIDLLTDCLDIGKIVYKKGLAGTIILGDKLQKVFTALPEHFTITDYDVHITPSTQIMKETMNIQSFSTELVKAGLVEADTAVDAISARSLSELKQIVKLSYDKKKKENDQLSKMQLQIEQDQQQLQLLNQQLQQAQLKVEQLNEAKIEIDKARYKAEADIKWYQAQTDRDFKISLADNDTKRTDIEYAQLFDGNPRNDEVLNE